MMSKNIVTLVEGLPNVSQKQIAYLVRHDEWVRVIESSINPVECVCEVYSSRGGHNSHTK